MNGSRTIGAIVIGHVVSREGEPLRVDLLGHEMVVRQVDAESDEIEIDALDGRLVLSIQDAIEWIDQRVRQIARGEV